MADKEIAKTTGNDVVPSFIEVGGLTGFEGMDSACVSIPFLRLAQVNTPQCQGPDKIPGLEPGMYFNPSTGRVYGKDPMFCILGFYRSWNEWAGEPPQAKFVASMSNEEFESKYKATTSNVNGKIVDAQGNRFQDTRNFFLLSIEHPEDGVLLYPMTSTGIPASKKWLAKATAVRAKAADGSLSSVPMYSRVWSAKVQFIQSPKGNYYQIADVTDMGWIDKGLVAPVKAAFEEAQAYIRERVTVVESHADDEPDWVKA